MTNAPWQNGDLLGRIPDEARRYRLVPNYLINGEVYGPDFDPVFRAHRIKQMVYTWTTGEEQLFPQYYVLPPSLRLHPAPTGSGRVQEMFEHASFMSHDSFSSVRPESADANQADVIIFVAGWGIRGFIRKFLVGVRRGTGCCLAPCSA